MSLEWCRACGTGQSADVAACTSCGVDFSDTPPGSPHVGLVYAVPGKLRITKRLGICTRVDGNTAYLHLSAKEKESNTAVPVTSLTTAEKIVPQSLSTATRLIYAARLKSDDAKQSWDKGVLLERAGELAGDSVREMRAVADAALTHGWDDIIAWTRLTDSEKAWRHAHHAATSGDLDVLATQLSKLPADGYHARIALLVPHLRAVAEHTSCRALIEQWRDAGLPAADTVYRLLGDDWNDGMIAGLELFPDAAGDRREFWSRTHQALHIGEPEAPLGDDCPAWQAASVVVRGRAGEAVGGEVPRLTRRLPVSIIDDLIEADGIGDDLDLSFADDSERRYLLSRLRPHELTDDEAADAGHDTELARRRFLSRDRDGLLTLPPSPGVLHYQALHDAAEGNPPDRERVRGEAADLLEIAARAVSAIANGDASNLPAPIAKDPSLWGMFAEHAKSGRLSPDADSRRTYPELANWCDLHRLLGLLWDERWHDAIAFGERLIDALDGEDQRDEALSLAAYALLRTDRGEDAIAMLEKAMADNYSDALLVNLSVAATEAKPEVAAPHFARIADEAPNHELRIAAMRRAVDVWGTTDADHEFPKELVGPLEVVLKGECSVEDYVSFLSLASGVAPEVVVRLPVPDRDRAPIHRLHRAMARLATDADFYLADLASELLAIHKEVGRPDWFNDEWNKTTRSLTSSVFTDFGEAAGSARFIDDIYLAAPDLFTQTQRFILLPQAGAHLAADFTKQDGWLKDEAMEKFFFQPIEEFLSERSTADPGILETVADNFHLTLFVATANRMETERKETAKHYNELVQRLRWDSQNRLAILAQMRAILTTQAQSQEFIDRVVDRLQRLAVDTAKGRERLQLIANELSDWRAETVRLRAQL